MLRRQKEAARLSTLAQQLLRSSRGACTSPGAAVEAAAAGCSSLVRSYHGNRKMAHPPPHFKSRGSDTGPPVSLWRRPGGKGGEHTWAALLDETSSLAAGSCPPGSPSPAPLPPSPPQRTQAFVFDLDGCLLRGREVLPAARRALEQVCDSGLVAAALLQMHARCCCHRCCCHRS